MEHKIIFKAKIGSQAQGTSTPESDEDFKGIYIQPIDDLISYGYEEFVKVNKDETYYEVRRFLDLLSLANPEALELLYSPSDCIIVNSPQFKLIRENKEKFITKLCAKTFANYAYNQIKKSRGTDKKINWEAKRVDRKTPLDFIYYTKEGKSYPITEYLNKAHLDQERCGLVKLDHMKDCYTLYYDFFNAGYRGIIAENSNEIRLSSVNKESTPLMMVYYNSDAFSKHCKDFSSYQLWLKERNINRFHTNVSHGQLYDSKNISHCRRLIDICLEIATTGTFTVKRPNADYLLSIKRGEVPLDKIIEDAERDIAGLQELYDKSNLPESVDPAFVKELLLKIRKMPITNSIENISTKSLPFDSNKIIDEMLDEEIENNC